MPKTKQPKPMARKTKVVRARPVRKRTRGRTDAKVSGAARAGSKLEQIVVLMRGSAGATIEQLVTVTGWQAHSVRGAISGSLKKKLGFAIKSDKSDGGRIYRIVAG